MINRVLCSAAVLGCLSFGSLPAVAQLTVPGCNPQVTAAMAAKNDAMVGYDMTVIQQAYAKPDSVLAMTCFHKAAGLSATEGGKIFSESFEVALAAIIEPWLTSFYDEFQDAAGEGASGWMQTAYQAAATTLDLSGPAGTADECEFVEQWWTEDAGTGGTNLGFKNKGIQLEIPNITIETLRSVGTDPVGAGVNFLQKWAQLETDGAGNALNIRTNLDNALTAIEAIRPTMPAAGFLNQNTVCAVLNQGGCACGAGCPDFP